jgi:hypothetical protein
MEATNTINRTEIINNKGTITAGCAMTHQKANKGLMTQWRHSTWVLFLNNVWPRKSWDFPRRPKLVKKIIREHHC